MGMIRYLHWVIYNKIKLHRLHNVNIGKKFMMCILNTQMAQRDACIRHFTLAAIWRKYKGGGGERRNRKRMKYNRSRER